MAFDESLHPRLPAGKAGGGEFGKASNSKTAKTTTTGKGGTAHHDPGPLKTTLSYDPKKNHGPGYGEKNGDPHVHQVQEALTRLGITDAHGHKLDDDGKLGPLTTQAVKAAQRKMGLKADGQVTPELLTKLLAAKSLGTTTTRRSAAEPDTDPEDQADDVNAGAARAEVPLTYRRTFELEGIEILSRAKGYPDGRTVEAYAAVFDVPKEIRDQHGHYVETNDASAFNRTINGGAARRSLVLYNHGFDARGKSGGLPTVPLGHPVEVRADRRGLLTISRYNESEFADTVLEAIRNQDITAQSYEGPIYRSDPMRVPVVRRGQPLPKVRRLELGLRNYGPTPTPYFPEAEITAVRSAATLAEEFASLDPEQRDELIRALATTPGWDSELAAVLATPHRGPGAEDPPTGHSDRLKLLRLRAKAVLHGV